MSFVEGFYSFNIELTDAETGKHQSIRHKIPRHPYEPDEYFLARIVALLYVFDEGLLLSQGYFEPDEPALWKKDSIGLLLDWIEVGSVEGKRLRNVVKAASRDKIQTRFSVFFWNDEQLTEFCDQLKGTTVNWIEHVRFYSLAPESLRELSLDVKSSMRWVVTLSVPHLYITTDVRDHELLVREIDVWERYQQVISNH